MYLLSVRHVFEISCQCNPSPVNCTDRAPALHRAWWHWAVMRGTSFSDVFVSPEQVYVYKPQSLFLQVPLGAVNCRIEITYLFACENCQILEWFSLEVAFWDFLIRPPCASRVSWNRLSRTMSSWVLNVGTDVPFSQGFPWLWIWMYTF